MAVPSESVGAVNYFARSSSCVLSKRSCERTWSLVVTPHIQRIIARSLRCRQCKSGKVGAQVSLGTPGTRIVNSSSGEYGKWARCEDGQEVIKFAPSDIASCDNSDCTTANWGQALTKVTEGWHHIKLLLTHFHLYRLSAIYWSDLFSAPFTPGAGIRLQAARDATAFLVGPTGTFTEENGIFADALETHTKRLFTRLLKHIEPQCRYRDLGFAHVKPKSLSFHVGLPEDQRLLSFLQRFSDDDQVICVQVFPGTSYRKLLGEGFQNREG